MGKSAGKGSGHRPRNITADEWAKRYEKACPKYTRKETGKTVYKYARLNVYNSDSRS